LKRIAAALDITFRSDPRRFRSRVRTIADDVIGNIRSRLSRVNIGGAEVNTRPDPCADQFIEDEGKAAKDRLPPSRSGEFSIQTTP
jgi:hypothetical protein